MKGADSRRIAIPSRTRTRPIWRASCAECRRFVFDILTTAACASALPYICAVILLFVACCFLHQLTSHINKVHRCVRPNSFGNIWTVQFLLYSCAFSPLALFRRFLLSFCRRLETILRAQLRLLYEIVS